MGHIFAFSIDGIDEKYDEFSSSEAVNTEYCYQIVSFGQLLLFARIELGLLSWIEEYCHTKVIER